MTNSNVYSNIFLASLKNIRELRGISQKDIFPNNANHSAYSKLENGTTSLKIDHLDEILNSLDISLEELFHWTYSTDNVNKFRTIFKEIGRHPNDLEKKKDFLREFYFNDIPIKNMSKKQLSYYCTIKNHFGSIWKEVGLLTKEEIALIVSLLDKKSFYSQYDYTIALNIVQYLTDQQLDSIVSDMLPVKFIEKRTPYLLSSAFNILTNAITCYVYKLDYIKAWDYVQLAEPLVKYTTGYYSKVNLEYSKCLVKRFLERDIRYFDDAWQIINITRAIGDYQTADEMETEINNLSTRADYYLDFKHYESLPINE
ncbi:hypothetical protein A5819_003536 [Enterococcus sp. 7E2_DIV0204]|uniref:helix-turn-helix domain-containing protein n=1 Tax=unclassified Enterococcus TaxID=2608891 RepID=UPI000A332D76|nr:MULTISPECIES: helix-turn-helix transcriptional regulator [unclassified Enterococcus]OTN83986.1 hypothetical protein A5819_003536 [Enterococcus sp. 7E2_DIV0204]OTP47231.1 hypothetical protein A5884_003606 [Enterococcus sp. 7D2_DIV0200]